MLGRFSAMGVLILASMSFAAGVHVHGEGALQVAVEGQVVDMVLTLPAMDVVGFEGPPDTDLKQKQIDDAVTRLKSGDEVFLFPEAAACVASSVAISGDQVNHRNGHSRPDHSLDPDNGHADFVTHYQFRCGRVDALNRIELRLFHWLPEVALRVEMITAAGARFARLNYRSPVMEVPVSP